MDTLTSQRTQHLDALYADLAREESRSQLNNISHRSQEFNRFRLQLNRFRLQSNRFSLQRSSQARVCSCMRAVGCIAQHARGRHDLTSTWTCAIEPAARGLPAGRLAIQTRYSANAPATALPGSADPRLRILRSDQLQVEGTINGPKTGTVFIFHTVKVNTTTDKNRFYFVDRRS